MPGSAWCYWQPKLCSRFLSAGIPIPEVCFIPSKQQTTTQVSGGATPAPENTKGDYRLYLQPPYQHQPIPAQTSHLIGKKKRQKEKQNTKHSFLFTLSALSQAQEWMFPLGRVRRAELVLYKQVKHISKPVVSQVKGKKVVNLILYIPSIAHG